MLMVKALVYRPPPPLEGCYKEVFNSLTQKHREISLLQPAGENDSVIYWSESVVLNYGLTGNSILLSQISF